MKIKDLPENQRPREKLLKFGPESLSDKELLAKLSYSESIKLNIA